jgi:hypothetical protein
MAAPRRVIEIAIEATDLIELEAIARSRTEWACRVQRARIPLAYHANPTTYAVGEAIGVTHQTVQRRLDRAVRFGVMAALDDSPRRGEEPTITDAARAWVVSLACQDCRSGMSGADQAQLRRGDPNSFGAPHLPERCLTAAKSPSWPRPQ